MDQTHAKEMIRDTTEFHENGGRSVALKKLALAKPPRKATTHGLVYRFQVFSCNASGDVVPPFDIFAETQGEARFHAESLGLEVKSIGVGRPVFDAAKEILNGRDEVSAFMGIEETTLGDWIARGVLKKSRDGDVFTTRTRLITFFEENGLKIPNSES